LAAAAVVTPLPMREGTAVTLQSTGQPHGCSNQPIYPITLRLREPRTLDKLLNYRLLRLYAARTAPVTRLMEGRWGMTRREWRLLALMAEFGASSPSELAERAQLDRACKSKFTAAMVAKI